MSLSTFSPTSSGSSPATSPQTDGRRGIYYWKCDRPSAFHGVLRETLSAASAEAMELQLRYVLGQAFPGEILLQPGGGQGNHLTFRMLHQGRTLFVRLEDGTEADNHLDVESAILQRVQETGVPVPRVYFTDTTRRHAPFAVQVIEYLDARDMNSVYQSDLPAGTRLVTWAEQIGRAVAKWQDLHVEGFGHFDPINLPGKLSGYHPRYRDYFQLNLSRHLEFLEEREFLTTAESDHVRSAFRDHDTLLDLKAGVLVHKDLALWNILGDADGIRAYIDWDDAIAGDPADDLSLLACFYHEPVISAAVRGYTSVRPLPDAFPQRLWLHLLRNMVVKAVIRCGAGYFKRSASFLSAPGQSGKDLRKFTHQRIMLACRGLRENLSLEHI